MKVEIVGIPLDLGAGRRGVDMGPTALRIANIRERLQAIGCEVVDAGDISVHLPEVRTVVNPKLKYLPEIAAATQALSDAVRAIVGQGSFPLVLGGDHSIAIGTVAGVSAALREQERSLGMIWIDAHGDMNTAETTPSGNIHGMPFAVCLGKGAPELTGIGGDFQKIQPENAVLIGARSLDEKERTLIRESGISVYTMEAIDRQGISKVMDEALNTTLKNVDAIHVSLDMDALDPQFAQGVGTPVRGGLTYREAHAVLEFIAASGKLCSLEVVEVNPVLDIRNETAEIVVDLVLSALGKRIL
ncbi:MAG TPA: arginase [Bacteroidetes bacterium]|nr:arginase [Bacteroidota bacterium]